MIDTTTGDPEATERTAEHLRKRRVAYLDATVGGSSRQVQTGAAIVMVGANSRRPTRATTSSMHSPVNASSSVRAAAALA